MKVDVERLKNLSLEFVRFENSLESVNFDERKYLFELNEHIQKEMNGIRLTQEIESKKEEIFEEIACDFREKIRKFVEKAGRPMKQKQIEAYSEN